MLIRARQCNCELARKPELTASPPSGHRFPAPHTRGYTGRPLSGPKCFRHFQHALSLVLPPLLICTPSKALGLCTSRFLCLDCPYPLPSPGQTPLRLSSGVPCSGWPLRTQNRCPNKTFLITQVSPQLLSRSYPSPFPRAHKEPGAWWLLHKSWHKEKVGTNVPDQLKPCDKPASGLG